MLLASIRMFLQLYLPSVDAFNHVDSHLPQPRHVSKDSAKELDGVLDGIIHVHSWIPLCFNPLRVYCILTSLIEILLLEKSQKLGSLSDISLNLIDALDAGLHACIHPMVETAPIKQLVKLGSQSLLDLVQLSALEKGEDWVEIESRMRMQEFLDWENCMDYVWLGLEVAEKLEIAQPFSMIEKSLMLAIRQHLL